MIAEILCEGYHDRSFWSGFLLQRANFQKCDTFDGKKVTGGRFGYKKESAWLIVTPCDGKTNVRTKLEQKLENLGVNQIDYLIVNLDPDQAEFKTEACKQSCQGVLDKLKFSYKDKGTFFEVSSGKRTMRLAWVLWGTKSAGGVHLPGQQSLERMVFKALLDVYPERGPIVEQYLNAAPQSEIKGKSYTWAYMSKWAADSGCDHFLASLWSDDAVSTALETTMRETGAWEAIEHLRSLSGGSSP